VENLPNKTNEGVTLEAVESAVRSSWSIETCDPTDVDQWAPQNPSRGQCAVTSLVLHDLFGGDLLEAEVRRPDGSRQGYHYWNRLNGVEIDLTREQFSRDEVVQEPHVIDRSPEFPWRAHEQYLVFRHRVRAALELQATGAG
jgi:hypothetical protein